MSSLNPLAKKLSVGEEAKEAFRASDYGEDEIREWELDTRNTFIENGYTKKEVNKFFGVVEYDEKDTKEMNDLINTNFKNFVGPLPEQPSKPTAQQESPFGVTAKETEAREARGILDAFNAAWQTSVPGTIINEAQPSVILPEDADTATRLANNVASLAFDIPVMALGMLATAPVGFAFGGPFGAGLTGTAGAFGAPPAIRKLLVQHYKEGKATTFSDLYAKMGAVFLENLKGGAVGVATFLSGFGAAKVVGIPALEKVVGETAITSFGKQVLKKTTVSTAELGTMVTVGKALEGEFPKARDFQDGAFLLLAFKGATFGTRASVKTLGKMSEKMADVWEKTGMTPEQIVEMGRKDPKFVEEMMSTNEHLPETIRSASDVKPPKTITMEPTKLGEKDITHDIFPPETPPIKMEVFRPEPGKKEPTKIRKKLDQSAEAVLERIGVERGASDIRFTWNELYRRVMDDLHPLKQLQKVLDGEEINLPIEKNFYALARLARGNMGRADVFLSMHRYNFKDLKRSGEPLQEIIKPHIKSKNLDGLRAYMISSRVMELSQRLNKKGKPIATGVEINTARKVVAKGDAKFKKTFERLQEFQNDSLRYLKDSGVLSEEAFNRILEHNKNYIPLNRIIEGKLRGKGAGVGLNVRQPIKNLIGSEKKFVDPIQSIIKNTYLNIAMAERNRVLTTLVERAELKQGDKALIVKQKTPVKPIDISPELNRFLKEHGLSANSEDFNIYRPLHGIRLAADEFVVFRNGKREVYKADGAIATAIKGLDAQSTNLLVKVLALPAKGLRAGVTLSPEFGVRNLVRDAVTAFTLSKNGFIPVWDSMRGLGAIFLNKEIYADFLKAGGGNSAIVSMDRNYIQNNVFKLSKDASWLNNTKNVVRSPLEMLRIISELSENSTRLGEFRKATEGKTKSLDNLFSGALDAREVTIDFARIGASTRAANMMIAFFNPQLQGVDRLGRAFLERPGQTMLKASSITAISTMLWMVNKDDPRYQALHNWEKDLFWIVLTKDHIYRIPKPFELGIIFGSVPERILEAYGKQNPKAFQNLSDTMIQAFTPSFIPTAVIPATEQWAKKSLFTGNNLIPSRLEKVTADLQTRPYTTRPGKAIAGLYSAITGINDPGTLASPIIIENYIRAWTGGLGNHVLQIADRVMELADKDAVAKPSRTAADIPFVKAFVVRWPRASTQHMQDFFDAQDKRQIQANSIRELISQQRISEVTEKFQDPEVQANLVKLDGMQKAIAQHRRLIHLITHDKNMTGDEKRQEIDKLYTNMNQIAQYGNLIGDIVDKALNKTPK